MKNDIFIMLKLFEERCPEKFAQVTEKQLKRFYNQLSQEVNTYVPDTHIIRSRSCSTVRT
ncbi:MAG: hypothetical protein PHS82_00465 [Lachnospiraceae bacterium]|nr:hypothetical protein [Lachnospiraceae bacterium]